MFLVIGLGNPGKNHKKTRHNIGFLALNKIQKELDFPDFKFEKNFQAETSEGNISGKKIILAKPQTFMNNSGQAVRKIADFYKISPDNILVVHDDLDIELGKYKTAEDSRSAGHNGVQSIIDRLGTQKFRRFRIGLKRSDSLSVTDPADFVLGKLTDEEMRVIEKVLKNIVTEIEGINPEVCSGPGFCSKP